MPGVGIQIPPNLADWWPELVGPAPPISAACRRTAITSRPSTRFPARTRSASACARGYALTERLCVYPQYIDREWIEQGVLDTIRQRYWSFIPRRGRAGTTPRAIAPDLVARRSSAGATARRSAPTS